MKKMLSKGKLIYDTCQVLKSGGQATEATVVVIW